jgi:hypothetical protein
MVKILVSIGHLVTLTLKEYEKIEETAISIIVVGTYTIIAQF